MNLCLLQMGSLGLVINIPIGLFLLAKETRINMFHTLEVYQRKKGRKNQHLQLPTFQKNRVQWETEAKQHLLPPHHPHQMPQHHPTTRSYHLTCLRVCSIIDKHIDDPESFPQATPGAPWNPGDSSDRWTWFWGEKCPAVFFDRSNFASKSSLFWWW